MSHRPNAIQLNSFTVNTIAMRFDIPEDDVLDYLYEANSEGTTYYYIENAFYLNQNFKMMIFNEDEFEADFALKPQGIEDHFVPVLQVKA